MKKILILVLILVVCFIFLKHEVSPMDSSSKTPIAIVVTSGDSVSNVATKLVNKQLIRNTLIFRIIAKKEGLEQKLQAGDFTLSRSMSLNEIISLLEKGPQDIWVTIPEGKRADEIAQILQAKLPQYNDTWKDKLENYEGYLFPDTYLFNKNATIDTIISEMTSNFDQKYSTLTFNTSLNKQQVVILASLVEREGKTDQDRPLIASVFMNRLKAGMALQVDATVQYALGFDQQDNTWWKNNLSSSDLKFNSAYNTYLITGLPPGPICNPGLKALQAAANPAQSNYLFYLADKNGVTHFAKTLKEQNANIKQYGL